MQYTIGSSATAEIPLLQLNPSIQSIQSGNHLVNRTKHICLSTDGQQSDTFHSLPVEFTRRTSYV